jgi:UDP-N-acetyl-2-amino-2-deoxyglucuronate dehydrogenase
MKEKKHFALIGAAGFVAPRHMKAIFNTGNKLVAACDNHDNVGILDRYFPDAKFFTEVERFERFLEKRKKNNLERVDFVSICSPNYLHDSHCRLALRAGSDAICEKPLVISPWNLDQLAFTEQETGQKIYNILQLRLHESVVSLKNRLSNMDKKERINFDLTYVTRRGSWYHQSWKGNEDKSGSLAMNIGVHFFDMLLWLFGDVVSFKVYVRDGQRLAGHLELKNADVRWFLSISEDDLPIESIAKGNHAFRSLKLNDEEFDFSNGFDDLHQSVYEDILSGGGFGIEDARAAIELVYKLRFAPIAKIDDFTHPIALKHVK